MQTQKLIFWAVVAAICGTTDAQAMHNRDLSPPDEGPMIVVETRHDNWLEAQQIERDYVLDGHQITLRMDRRGGGVRIALSVNAHVAFDRIVDAVAHPYSIENVEVSHLNGLLIVTIGSDESARICVANDIPDTGKIVIEYDIDTRDILANALLWGTDCERVLRPITIVND